MQPQLFLVHETDVWHSRSSQVLMGVFDDKDKAKKAILKEMSKNKVFNKNQGSREDAEKALDQWNQTQGFDTNYTIQKISLNEWGVI